MERSGLCILPSPRSGGWKKVGDGWGGRGGGQATVSPGLLPVRCARGLGPQVRIWGIVRRGRGLEVGGQSIIVLEG